MLSNLAINTLLGSRGTQHHYHSASHFLTQRINDSIIFKQFWTRGSNCKEDHGILTENITVKERTLFRLSCSLLNNSVHWCF